MDDGFILLKFNILDYFNLSVNHVQAYMVLCLKRIHLYLPFGFS